MGVAQNRRAIIRAAAAGAVWAGMASGAYAVDTIYVGPPNGTWDSNDNWRQAGPNTLFFDGDDVFVQPGTADAAIVLDNSTVDLSSAETVLELQVSHAANGADTQPVPAPPGVKAARLNVGAGAALVTNGNSSGIRIGRALDAGQAVGSSRGEIVQTGGSVVIQQGSNGLRLSQADSGNVGDSLYRISGGSLRGGAGADGTMVSNLALGTVTNVWGQAEFHVVGSAATSIRFLDVAMGANTSGNGDTIMHFSIDSGGVTPIIAEDELQWRGAAGPVVGDNLLQIDLIAAPPEADITLFTADRLNTNGIPSGAANEHFSNVLEGDAIVRQFGGFEYTWLMDYTDAPVPPQTSADDGVLDASVVLRYQGKTAIPEPTGLALLAFGGLALARRRRQA